jgi:transcriptional regulator
VTLYNPPLFRVDDLPTLHAHIDAVSLATLVTVGADAGAEGGPLVSHVPLLLDRERGEFGMLIGHLAKANPQAHLSDLTKPALAIFMGPDAYITPSWYPSKAQHGRVVPTWNYTTVHARGEITFFDDPVRLRAIVDRLTGHLEGRRAQPWQTSDAPEAFIASQLSAIIGFELAITKLDGKFKLSQNRVAADQAGVIAGLAGETDPGSKAVLEQMKPRS